jgi:hypothetical protein
MYASVGVVGRQLLRIAAAAVLVLNLVDAALTLAWTTAGLAHEANPLLDGVLARSPLLFMTVKLSLVSLGLLLLWRLRWRRAAGFAIVGSALAYSALCAYHLTAMERLVATLS